MESTFQIMIPFLPSIAGMICFPLSIVFMIASAKLEKHKKLQIGKTEKILILLAALLSTLLTTLLITQDYLLFGSAQGWPFNSITYQYDDTGGPTTISLEIIGVLLNVLFYFSIFKLGYILLKSSVKKAKK